jgi:hypothetical protein
MGIVLLEPPDSGQTAQCAAGFIPVQHAKVGKTQGQLLVTPFLQWTGQQLSDGNGNGVAYPVAEHHRVGCTV